MIGFESSLKRVIAVAAIAAAAMVALAPVALAAEPPTVQIGVVAQHYPWDGKVDVTVKVANAAPTGAKLVVTATPKGGDPIEVKTVENVQNGEQKVTFDAKAFPALSGKRIKDLKISAKIVQPAE